LQVRLPFHKIFDIDYAKSSGRLNIPEEIRAFKLSLLLESSIDVDGLEVMSAYTPAV
jgi:hypothetical protein